MSFVWDSISALCSTPWPIFRVDHLDNDDQLGFVFSGRTHKCERSSCEPEDSAGTHIPSPLSLRSSSVLPPVTLTHAQFCIRTLPLGDVGNRSHELQAARLAPRGTATTRKYLTYPSGSAADVQNQNSPSCAARSMVCLLRLTSSG